MTSAFISLPSLGLNEQTGWVREGERRTPKPAVSQRIVLDWSHRHSAQGLILSARIADMDRSRGAESSACVHMALDDRQLRALTIDLVKASMMRGIEFKRSRKWWQVW